MDDQSILQLIRTGKNDLALNALYRSFPAIRNLIRSKGGHRSDAEDIFQEALLILLRKAAQPDFQLTAKLSTYLYSVCRHLWNDTQRRRQPTVPFEDIAAHNEIASKDPAEPPGLTAGEEIGLAAAIRDESRIRLAEQALNDLKDRCRELLLLFYKRQLSLKVIAAQMGYTTEASAKNQKYKCLEAARNRLKELRQQQTQIV